LHEDLGEFWEKAGAKKQSDERKEAEFWDWASANKNSDNSAPSQPSKAQFDKWKAENNIKTEDAVQRHARAPTPEPPDPDLVELDQVEMLVAMGFDEKRAKAALLRCSSLEAAVEYIMLQGEPSTYTEYVEPAASAIHQKVVQPAAQGIYTAAERAGVAEPASRAASKVANAVHPAAQGLYGVAERAGAGLYDAVFQPVAQRIYGDADTKPEPAPAGNAKSDEVAATLVAFGFSEKQAKEAASRCSSTEAAVEWIMAHPECG